MIFVQSALTGVLVGGLYALMAIGMSLTWGMLRVINLAHFGLILLSGYLTYHLATNAGVDPLLTLVVTVPVMFVIGAAIQWGFQHFKVSELSSLLVSFGLLIMGNQLISNVWSADFRRMTSDVNPYATGSLALGPLVFPMPTLIASVAAAGLVLCIHYVLARTFVGRALRAFGEDPAIASAFGIDHERLGLLLAGAAGATAAVAGTLFALGGSLTPSTAFEWFGVVFAVVILGGIGNVLGTLLAGALVGGIAGVMTIAWSPVAAPVVVYGLVVLALVFRPNGLLPRRGGHG
ncbi:MAG TPA: branched-chain amino acid ABC transporter permease [Candidatus Limnocylindria bacterium]|nr:branched-chain amino acid ABC transporter permease [Candidatus Limnocylindria bacterium]